MGASGFHYLNPASSQRAHAMRMEFGVAKIFRKSNDDQVTIFGVSGAAAFLQCAEGSVLNAANAGRLAHIRDSSGKRLFTLADLRQFKRTNRIGNMAANVRPH